MERDARVGRRKVKWLIAGVVLLIVLGVLAVRLGWFKPVDPAKFLRYEPGSYQVVAFRDGDTIVVDMNGTEETVRFIGVDTPETHKENTPVQCYGPAASAYTKSKIGENGRVRLVADRLTTNRDRYDRLLRYVYLQDGTSLNLELVQKGYAFAYDFPFAESRAFHDAQDAAKQSRTGLWGNCTPTQDPVTGQWHSNDQ